MKKIIENSYNFEDVLIQPRISTLNSRKNVNVNQPMDYANNPKMEKWTPVPIMSSNMDTVSGIDMAFALLKKNWIAVIHKYVSIKEMKELFDKCEEYNHFLEKKGEITLTDKNKFSLEDDYQKGIKIDFRNLFISRGTSKEDKIKLKERLEQEPRIMSFCVDVANGYREEVFEYVSELCQTYGETKIIMVGNMATVDAVLKYKKIGVDIVKLGIGSGRRCITRKQTGVGVPQLSCILDVASYLENFETKKEKKILIVSDGGCNVIGDVCKAFVGGSDFVMLGGMLAGHKECPGVEEEVNGKMMKRFSGMAAKESQWNGVSDYGVEEGRTAMTLYKGKIHHTLKAIEGGIRSCGTYINAATILDFRNTTFVKTTYQLNETN